MEMKTNSMFCRQCQETAGCTGCTKMGVCGKTPELSALQDVLLYATKGLAETADLVRKNNVNVTGACNRLIVDNLFSTITNVNFDDKSFINRISETIDEKTKLLRQLDSICCSGADNNSHFGTYNNEGISSDTGSGNDTNCVKKTDSAKEESRLSEAALWTPQSAKEYYEKAASAGILSEENEDIRSLKEMITYGLKGLAAYMAHADTLGKTDPELHKFLQQTLALTTKNDLTADALTALAMETGKWGVTAMALLDQANTDAYGSPEITTVNIGVRKNPAILISGHDLKDLEMLLTQTEGTGIDVYTHSEMLPAHYYPAFKKYSHFAGNYGNAWWKQNEEFESFNGPILMTTNCIVPPKDSYKNRLYTTGTVGYPGCTKIEANSKGEKDFSVLIEKAKTCQPPLEIETGEITGGFAHNQVLALADRIVDAVKNGDIRKFVVMAGCDGRAKSRNYYSDFAEALPKDAVILTAGCAKYKFNKLNLGDINGIPRVLDAGQCNDSYSLAVIALKLKEVFGLEDINDLPIVYNISWYEQKAVIVLLALLYLGVKNIHLGPTLPAFLSPNVAGLLVENFGISGIGTVDEDIDLFFS